MEIEITNQKNCSNPTISLVNYSGEEKETNEQFTDLENGTKYDGEGNIKYEYNNLKGEGKEYDYFFSGKLSFEG